jgi:putative flippase GtrA
MLRRTVYRRSWFLPDARPLDRMAAASLIGVAGLIALSIVLDSLSIPAPEWAQATTFMVGFVTSYPLALWLVWALPEKWKGWMARKP